MNWEKKPAIVRDGFAILLPLESIIAVGFGAANATKDGEFVYDEQDTPDGEQHKTCGDIEALAKEDPNHDWQISYFAPLYEAIYQRHGDDTWVLIEKGQGFA